MTEVEWQRFTERLTKLAELLRQEGFQLVYHHHMGTVIQTSEEIDRLMHETGEAVHLLLDTGHATWGGADSAALAADHERAEGGKLHLLARRQLVGERIQHEFDQIGGFRSRQADGAMNGLAKVSSCQRFRHERRSPHGGPLC